MVQVRIASKADAASLLDIYAPYIQQSTISFETVVPSIDAFEDRIEKCLEKFPWIICKVDGSLAAYVYASAHREREAYQWTCECSVYCAETFKGRGIGRILYQTLFSILKMQGFVNVYAGITLPNEASIRLHEKCGFRHFALYEKIGNKFGAWHDVGWWKLQLNDFQPEPPPPVHFSTLDPMTYAGWLRQAATGIRSAIKG